MRHLKVLACSLTLVALVCGMAGAQPPPKPPLGPLKWSQPVDNVNGWDMYSFWPGGADRPTIVVADDWRCLDGLPVTDFHWWGSYIAGVPGTVSSFEVSIHSDIPAQGEIPSHPGQLLKSYEFPLGGKLLDGLDGAAFPGGIVEEMFYETGAGHDIYQYNVVLPDPQFYFYQEQGQIYWLNIVARMVDDNSVWGWHTALRPPFVPENGLDPAVAIYDYDPQTGGYFRWLSLVDSHCNIQMAFELTTIPEPGTMALVGTAGLFVLGLMRRRRLSS